MKTSEIIERLSPKRVEKLRQLINWGVVRSPGGREPFIQLLYEVVHELRDKQLYTICGLYEAEKMCEQLVKAAVKNYEATGVPFARTTETSVFKVEPATGWMSVGYGYDILQNKGYVEEHLVDERLIGKHPDAVKRGTKLLIVTPTWAVLKAIAQYFLIQRIK